MGIPTFEKIEYPAPPVKPWSSTYIYRRHFHGLTQETLNKFKEDVQKWQNDCRAILDKRLKDAATLADIIVAAGFPESKFEYTGRSKKLSSVYIKPILTSFVRADIPHSPSLYEEENWLREKVKEEEEKARLERELKAANERTDKIGRAVLFLEARGKKLGTDFQLSGALEAVDDIAFKEFVDANKGEWNEFSGDDNCENCKGWDGESHRCECGNRRVSWMTHDHFDFENPGVYAEAY